MIVKCLKNAGVIKLVDELKASGLPVVTSEEVLQNMAIEKYGVYNLDFIGLCLRSEELNGLLSRTHRICEELSSRGALVCQFVDIMDPDDEKAVFVGEINPSISDLRVFKYTASESADNWRNVLTRWSDDVNTLPIVSSNIIEFLVEENLSSLE